MDEKNVKNPLSNYSYINKDFNNVWAELLAITSKLSAKWDPVASNESDPGVVLIKLISLLADKLNYNLDANMLELFPSTVAQPANAREIFNCLGYTMKWYRSGTGQVIMQYKPEEQEISSETNNTAVSDDELPATVTIPQFSMICTEDSDIIYTMLEEAMLYTPTESNIANGKYGIVTTVNVMQGIITDYELLGDTKITASNLDSKYRLYFNENNVAENGIFISNVGDGENFDFLTEWKKVDNLNTQEPQSKVYKFGITKDGICYIEFPKDIAPLITDGLYIKYILSEGVGGNISQYNLRKFYNNPSTEIEILNENNEVSTTTLTFTENNVAIQNTFAISNGFDPESIDEAYENYTRTVGVFNTLVSLRDYVNAIYTLGQNNEWISNDIVTDRTNDIQSGYDIVSKINERKTIVRENVLRNPGSYLSSDVAQLSTSYESDIIITSNTPYGGQSELSLIYGSTGNGEAQNNPNDSGDIDPGSLSPGESNLATVTLGDTDLRMDDYEVTPFDLKLYLLHYVPDPQSSLTNYNKTFQMVDNIEGDRDEIVDKILSAIDEYKSIQHNFIPILANRPAIFINTYPVKATIVPQYRVTEEQSRDIRENIYKALFKTFNSQNIDFGEEVTYDEVYDIIASSDERIKSIILDPLKFTTNVVFYNTLGEYVLTSTDGTEFTIKNNEWNMIPFDINTEIPINESEKVNWGIDCFAKSVLAGRTNLYETESAFNFSLAQSVFAPTGDVEKKIVDKVNFISTKFETDVPTDAQNPLTLNNNENIYIQAPNYYDSTNFSSGVKYEYKLTEGRGGAEDGVDYKLMGDEYIVFYYKENDSDTYYRYKFYKNITICPKGINLSEGEHLFKDDDEHDPAKMMPTSATKFPVSGKISQSTYANEFDILSKNTLTRALSLTATKSISIRSVKEVTIKGSDNKFYYWILNQSIKGNDDESIFRLFEASDTTEPQRYQLKLNEYLLVSSQDMSTINVYGSGTVLTRSLDGSSQSITSLPAWEVKDFGETDINELGTEGIKDLSTTLPSGLQLNLKEMRFVALGKDAQLYANPDTLHIDNNAKSIGPVGSSISYKSSKSDSDFTEIKQLDLSQEELDNLEGWSIYSVLNLNISSETPQELLDGHSVILTDTSGINYTYSGNSNNATYIQSSSSIAREGGEHLDVSQYDIYTEKTEYPEFIGYTQSDMSQQSVSIENNFNCIISFEGDSSGDRIEKDFKFSMPEGEYIIPVLINSSNITDLKIELQGTGASIQLLNNIPNSSLRDTIYITSPNAGSWHYIKLSVKETQVDGLDLFVSINNPGEGIIKKVKFGGLSQRVARTYESYKGDFETAVLDRINNLDTEGRFDYSYEIPDEDYIEDPLLPLSFLNSKHIFNKFTICKIQPTTKKYMDNTTGDITVTNKIK